MTQAAAVSTTTRRGFLGHVAGAYVAAAAVGGAAVAVATLDTSISALWPERSG